MGSIISAIKTKTRKMSNNKKIPGKSRKSREILPPKKKWSSKDLNIRELSDRLESSASKNGKYQKKWRVNYDARELTGLLSGDQNDQVYTREQKEAEKRPGLLSVFDLTNDIILNTHESKDVGSPVASDSSSTSTLVTDDLDDNLVVRASKNQTIEELSIRFGAYSTKGCRSTNEDSHHFSKRSIKGATHACFGVYDGHGGDSVSEFLARNLHKNVLDNVENGHDMKYSIEKAFFDTDSEIIDAKMESGSTAIFALITKDQLVVASVGDSQAVLAFRNGEVCDMCASHKPSLPLERARIERVNGKVINGRIFGVLGVSRAFGDIDMKTSRGQFCKNFNGDLVSSNPDVKTHVLSEEDEFLVLACDGLFDVMTPAQSARFVRKSLITTRDAQDTSKALVNHALSLGSKDNVTAIVICLRQSDLFTMTPGTP